MKFFILIFLLVLSAYIISSLENNEKYCGGINYYKELSWNGRIINKYLDSLNHGYQTILIKEKYGVSKVYFITDTSRVYKILNIGDSVEKAKDSLAVYVTVRNSRKRYVLKYICN